MIKFIKLHVFKLLVSVVIILTVVLTMPMLNVSAGKSKFSDLQTGVLAFNDYGWVLLECMGTSIEKWELGSCNVITRTYRDQFSRVTATRSDWPSGLIRMTNLEYRNANGTVRKTFNMNERYHWSTPDWEYSSSRENFDDYSHYRSVNLYSYFQTTVAASGSVFAGYVFKFESNISI